MSLIQLVKDARIFDCPLNSDPSKGIKVYCSCDGLVLIGIWSHRHVEQPSILLIWNPSTRESILLPHSKFSLQMGHDTNTGDDDEHMGDDSNNSGDDDDFTNVEEDYGGCTYGLAYDPISDDYKVFMISMFRPDDNEIFTLKNNASWRIIDHKISGRTDSSSMLTGGEYLPFVHGAFHWIGMLSRFCVVSFNISDEMYGEISLPAIVCCLTLSKSEVEVEVDVGVSLLGEMLSVYCKDENFFYFMGNERL